MAALKGKVALWGVDGFSMTVVAALITDMEVQNYDLTRDSDKEMLSDDQGEVVGLAYFNAKKTFNVSVIPSHDTTIAGAVAAMDSLLPAPGTIITIAEDSDELTDSPAALDSEHSGKYVCDSARINRTNRSFAAIDLTLTQYDANDVAVALP